MAMATGEATIDFICRDIANRHLPLIVDVGGRPTAMVRQLLCLLEAVVVDPDRPIHRLPLAGEAERRARSRSLVLLPYLAGATAVPLSAALNPYGLEFVFTSALSTFGGCAWMVWIAMDPLVEAEEARVGRLPSGRGWWVGGALALLYLFALLGPCLRFS